MKLPAYKSHKIVHAAKIASIGKSTGGMTRPLVEFTYMDLELPNGNKVSHRVSNDYIAKHDPQVGGYLVIYEDGYESWSPGPQFEAGYDICEPTP